MNSSAYSSAAAQYGRTAVQTSVAAADPHKLIQMLMEGALDKIAVAKGAMNRQDHAAKGKQINWAIAIIDGLRSSLDMESGGEISVNLDGLYEYMTRRLAEANARADASILDEVATLLRDIKDAWVAIGPVVRSQNPGQNTASSSFSIGA